MLRAEVIIRYNGEVGVTVKVLCIPIRILPPKEKKVRLRDYSVKSRAKKEAADKEAALKKARKKAEKKQKKEEAKARKKAMRASGKAPPEPTLTETVSNIVEVIKIAVGRFGRHLRVRIARLHIAVATGDAASTAILYGVVSQSVCYLAALLDSTSTLRYPARSDVDVHADFLSETTVADVEIGFSIRVWQVFDIGIRSGFAFIKNNSGGSRSPSQPKKAKNNRKD